MIEQTRLLTLKAAWMMDRRRDVVHRQLCGKFSRTGSVLQ